MDLGLAGLKAIVTGGTRGIGRAVVERLLAEGCEVALCARDAAGVDATVAALSARGPRVIGTAVDVGDGALLADWVAASAERLGGLDIVIANASALAVALTDQAWAAGFSVDLMGTVHAVDAALPHLRRSEAGAIVAVASTAALEIYAGLRSYNSFKAALIAYVGGLAIELAPEHIRANSVCPGSIYSDQGTWQRAERDNPDAFRAMLARNPMGRMGRPEEMANAIAFLASPAASFITGANLVADGGLTRRIQY